MSAKKSCIEIECRHCGLDALCAFLEYGEGDTKLPEGTLLRAQPISRGEIIFKEGEPFHSFIAVQSGSFKTMAMTPQGQEKVIGFHLAGEMIGTEGIAGNCYTSTARALESGAICKLRLGNLQRVGCSEDELQSRVISILGNEVAFSQRLHSTLIRQSSEQRLAAFILSLFFRKDKRGIHGMEFRLSMSRSDIASYLGLASETVSRILMKLQKLSIIKIRNKQVRILNLDALDVLANSG
jgi:CRP/FNR family transcriptional regulator, anaerobic regulatory protein